MDHLHSNHKYSVTKNLYEALSRGDEDGAVALLDQVQERVCYETGLGDCDENWILSKYAIENGFTRLAMAMIESKQVESVELDEALLIAAESHCLKSFDFFSTTCSRTELLSCAYQIALDVDSGAREVYNLALSRAEQLQVEAWDGACGEGLAARWDARFKGHYEHACEALHVPLWSASAASSVSLNPARLHRFADKPPVNGVESMEHQSSALGLPEETLLWGKADVKSLSLENMRQKDNPSWQGTQLAAMLKSWDAACAYLPRAIFLAKRVKKDSSKRFVNIFEKEVVALGIEHWVPFILAWSIHQSFGADEVKAFGPVLKAGIIDASNVGLVAANIDYGSFNARISVIAIAMRQAGSMDDTSTVVVNARLEDLLAHPKHSSIFSNLVFGAEMNYAKDFFQAESSRVALITELGEVPVKALSKQRGRTL